jgi:hypothetical protein
MSFLDVTSIGELAVQTQLTVTGGVPFVRNRTFRSWWTAGCDPDGEFRIVADTAALAAPLSRGDQCVEQLRRWFTDPVRRGAWLRRESFQSAEDTCISLAVMNNRFWFANCL